jgi:hypothetical protein
MNEELWLNYTESISSKLKDNNTPSTTNTLESIECTWNKIQNSIITAALQHIPNKKFTVRNFQHIFSSKASKLHYNLKKLGNIIRQVKHSLNKSTPIPTHHNSTLTQLNTQHQLQIPNILPDYSTLSEWINTANNEWKALYHAHNIKNIKEIKQQIDENITK